MIGFESKMIVLQRRQGYFCAFAKISLLQFRTAPEYVLPKKNQPLDQKPAGRFIAIFAGVLSAVAQPSPDANGIIYVKEGGTGNGSSWANATGNLQNAIDAASVQQVWVAKGTYQPASGVSFVMKPGVAIYGGFPDNNNNASMAQRNWSTYLTKLQGNGNSVVQNLNNALTSADILDGFTISGGSDGGGIATVKSSPSYVNLVITGNSATAGGGMYIASSAPHLTNVLISGNSAIYGGGMYNNSSAILTNVTISGNTAYHSNTSEWINPANAATPVIRNSIIYGNGVDGQLTDVQNSLVQNQTNAAYTNTLNNNLPTDTDPIFASPIGGNYTLQPTSPAINKGNNAFFVGLNANTKDLTGNSRVNDFSNSGVIDMGAYEYRIIPLVPDANGIIYVRESGVGNGSSWAEATVYFQAAINAANVQQVWVAQGTYQPASGQSFAMKQGVAIYGGFPNTSSNANMSHRNWATYVTTLQGNGSSVVKNENNALTPTDVLDGFTVTGGTADLGAGILNTSSSPGYRNLVITQNTANLAGGGILISESSAPNLINVLITGNTSVWYGGGLNNSSPSIFTNVTVSGNTASLGSEWNELFGTAVIRNSIIYGNGVHGQLYNTQNSLVQNQTHAAYNDAANHNLPTSTDPLFANPPVGNYELQSVSPAVDKGNASFFNDLDAHTKDLGGNLRLNEDAIDMGAYENQLSRPAPDANGVVYVRQGGSGRVKGNSWENALGDFQGAINLVGAKQVWVAKGTYIPASGQSFAMKQDVAIYGGFPDNDDHAGMEDRDWATHLTTLQGNGNTVVRNYDNRLTATAILDGFAITGGSAEFGGGILNFNSSPAYINLVVWGNSAGDSGGGINIMSTSAPKLTNMVVSGNSAVGAGGGMENSGSPVVTNVTISGNTAQSLPESSELFNYSSSAPIFRNSIIYGNGVWGDLEDVQYSLVQNQGSNVSYGEAGKHNLPTKTNPLFQNPPMGNYRLQTESPAINKGSNTFFEGLNTKSKDMAGNPRLTGSAIDMGAFESPAAPLPVRLISFAGRLNDQKQAVLTWKTDEINVSHYEIERSSNAKDFHISGTVTAMGTGSANYSVTDPKPVSGRVYYRIRMVDQDGTFGYSRMISLVTEGPSQRFAYPNPARDHISVELGTAYIGSKVKLFSTTGIVMQETEVKEETVTLDISRHTSGIYLLQLYDGQVVKLIKE